MRIPFLSRLFRSEKRSTLANPAPWLIEALGGRPTVTGVHVNEQNALRYTAVFAAVRILAETIASLPLPLYRRLDGGGKERAREHPLYTILHDQPNEEMTSFTFRETLQGHLATWGNAYAEIEFDNAGRVRALWPLRPDRVWPERDSANRRLRYKIMLPDGAGVILPADRVLHIPGLGFDGLVGYSPIRMAREAIGLGLAAEEFGARFFSNDARPGGVLEHPAKLSDEAHRRLRASWEERYQGLSNKHRIAILEEGMKFHEIGIPPEDAQFLDTRKFQVNEIARIYRIPPHMLGDLDRATFSNVEQQAIEFVVHTIRPWLVRWEQVLNIKLLTPEERRIYFAEFLVDGLLRGDIESRYRAYATGRQWGWLSANDVRELENMNPIEGGDIYYVPLNMVPAGSTGNTGSTGGRQNNESRSLIEYRVGPKGAAANRRKLANSYKRIITDTAARIIRRETADVMRAAERFLTRRDAGQFYMWLDDFYRDHEGFIERNMLPTLLTYAEAVHMAAAEEVGFEGDISADLEAFVRDYLASYKVRHIGSSKGQIRQVIRDAELAGLDPLEVLQERFDEWKERRPEKIGMAESIQAGNAVAKFVFGAAGIMRLRWVAQGSESCPYCQALDGRVVGIQSFFLGQGEEFKPDGADRPLAAGTNIGHPPLHEGCVCQIVPAP